ncbi:SDR family oxidoreductase [Thermoactinospora rubra]|uniref:SDR family oxidoreductase n=1 Tax=Thermoactinospora rubra TaxID=1088767 RepID=UPI000A10ADA7|nr:NAD(P)H-binding protein [Thermoactinospora rubra]
MRILVTGGTGVLGRPAVPRLVEAGHEVRAISRSPRSGRAVDWRVADLASGRGVREALEGVEAVVHLATLAHRGRRTASVDVEGTRLLLDAAHDAGVGHLLFLSIVGVEHAPVGYFGHKLRAEQLVKEGGVDWTILRATPFHQWLDQWLARLPVHPVDRTVPWQPVDARDVSGHLVTLLSQGPSKTVEEYGGPQVIATDELVARWRRARDRRPPALMVRWPGRVAAAQRAGLLNAGPSAPKGRITWAEYLRPAGRAVPAAEEEPDIAGEYGGPDVEPRGRKDRVYGQDEGYQPPTQV